MADELVVTEDLLCPGCGVVVVAAQKPVPPSTRCECGLSLVLAVTYRVVRGWSAPRVSDP